MSRLPLTLALLFLAPAGLHAESLPAHGLYVEKDNPSTADEFATATEYDMIEVFPTVTHFTTTGGKKVEVLQSLLAQVVDYDQVRPSAFREILKESDLAPIDAALEKLDAVSKRFRAAKKFLAPMAAGLEQEKQRFQKGQGKWDGRWFATRALAQTEHDRPIKEEAAESERQRAMAKAEADRQAAEAKMRSQAEEKVVMEEQGLAQEFRAEIADLLKQALAEKIWTEKLEDLKAVPGLPEEVVKKSEQDTERWKDLQAKIRTPQGQRSYESAVPSLEAITGWTKAARCFSTGDAPGGADALREVVSKYSAVSNPEIAPIWDQMLALYKMCQQREEEAQVHLKKARSLSAYGGKYSQAIAEFQAAYALYPSASVTAQIEKLRKDSLGL